MVKELLHCPDCDATITADSPEFIGDGTMARPVYCPDCEGSAVEDWELSEVRQLEE